MSRINVAKAFGRAYEEVARQCLLKNGFRVVKLGGGPYPFDIIARKGKTVYCINVKSAGRRETFLVSHSNIRRLIGYTLNSGGRARMKPCLLFILGPEDYQHYLFTLDRTLKSSTRL